MNLPSGAQGFTIANSVPCVGGYIGPQASSQINVVLGQTVSMTFGGTPPFNVSHSVSRLPGTTWCGPNSANNSNTSFTRIDTNTYTFTFQPYNWTYTNYKPANDTGPTPNGTIAGPIIQLPGDSIMFAATEIGNSPPSEGSEYPFFVSGNYTIVNGTTSDAQTFRSGSKFGMLCGVMLAASVVLSL